MLPITGTIKLFDLYKQDIRTMMEVLVDLHDHNISLLTLDSSNIVFDDESKKLKFSGLVFINASPERRKNDFTLLARVIENLNKKWIHIPYDLKDFIQLMLNYRDSDRDLLLNHIAIKTLSEKLGFVRNAFEKRHFLFEEDQNLYNLMIEDMDRSKMNLKDWRPQIRHSPYIGVKECLEFQPQSKRVNYQNTNYSILQFCRNLATHLPKNLRKAGCKATETESETYRIIMEHFGQELLSFQKLAHEYGILEHFMPGYTSSTSGGQTCTTQRQDYSRPDVGGREAHHRTMNRSRGNGT